MTIIDVARELEKDGAKRFRRTADTGTDWATTSSDGMVHDVRIESGALYDFWPSIEDLLATDWEEVKE